MTNTFWSIQKGSKYQKLLRKILIEAMNFKQGGHAHCVYNRKLSPQTLLSLSEDELPFEGARDVKIRSTESRCVTNAP